MSEAKELYKEFCEQHDDIPLFLKYHWINTVASNDEWDVVLAYNGNDITGFMPYFTKKKSGFVKITHPPLTPYMGVWVVYPEGQKYAKRLGHEKKIYQELFEGLPKFSAYVQNFYPTVTNWLPFYWKGCEQTTRYTYILENLTDLDAIFSGLKSNIRRSIRKAEKQTTVETGTNISDYFRLMTMDYKDKGKQLPYTEEFITRLFEHCHQQGCGKLFSAKDENDEVISTLFLVWDKQSSYYLAGASNPQYKSSGASSLLLWEAIKYTSENNIPKFNFEGSMIEPIENFFRAFGGQLTPFHSIQKTQSKTLKWKEFLID